MVPTGWWLRKRLGSKGTFGLVVSLMWETKVFLSKVRKVHSPVCAVGAQSIASPAGHPDPVGTAAPFKLTEHLPASWGPSISPRPNFSRKRIG